jgi:aldehyde:ferredoxin oxidoreductase
MLSYAKPGQQIFSLSPFTTLYYPSVMGDTVGDRVKEDH